MDKEIFEKARKELSVCQRKIWINQYVCKRKQRVVFPAYDVLVIAFAYLFFKKAFLSGAFYPIWMVLVGVIAVIVAVGIVSAVSTASLRKKAEQECTIPAITLDETTLADERQLLEEKVRMEELAKKDESTMVGFNAILPAAITLSCYGWFEWVQKLERPEGTVLYLICLCVFFVFCAGLIQSVLVDGTELPLSEDVKEALHKYHRACIDRAKIAAITSKPSPAEVERYRQRLREEERKAAEKQDAGCGAFGYPEEKGPNFIPDNLKGPDY